MTTTTSPAQTVRLPPAALTALVRGVASGRSAAEAAELLRHVGLAAAETVNELLEERVQRPASDLSVAEFWDGFRAVSDALGWGALEYRQPHAGIGELNSEAWFEADASGELGCQLTTGMLAAIFQRIAGGEMAVLEVECRARGADRCRFWFGGSEALGQVYASLAEGTSVDAALHELG